MKTIISLSITMLFFFSCSSQEKETRVKQVTVQPSVVDIYYKAHIQDSESKSIGTVSKGKLENGTVFPFEGTNYCYFDTSSYLKGRCYTHNKVKKATLDAYKTLEKKYPKRKFQIMECSNQHGGKMWPHRTHQNGLSIDFMVPLIKNGKPYYGLDNTGTSHYLLDFNNQGQYIKDTSISIDFEVVADHLLALKEACKENQLSIKKVILKTELKDELYRTTNGAKIKQSIYITRKLTPLINGLHDDHYHVDFELE